VTRRAIRGEKVKTWLTRADLVLYAAIAWENAECSATRRTEKYTKLVVDKVVEVDSLPHHGFLSANNAIGICTLEHHKKCVLTETVVNSNIVECKEGTVEFPALATSDRVEFDIVTIIEYV
jgi:hypothetical protein